MQKEFDDSERFTVWKNKEKTEEWHDDFKGHGKFDGYYHFFGLKIRKDSNGNTYITGARGPIMNKPPKGKQHDKPLPGEAPQQAAAPAKEFSVDDLLSDEF